MPTMAYFSSYLPTATLLPTSTSAPLCPISSSNSSSFTRKSFKNLHPLKTLGIPLVEKCNVLGMSSYCDQVTEEIDYTNTPYIPVYVKLPLDVVNLECGLSDEGKLKQWLKKLKDIEVDGVVVDCWWGIVESHESGYYNWKSYRRLFQIVREQKLKLQVIMSFHGCRGNVDDNVHIPLPQWVRKIGESNPNIYFTDRGGWHNPECLTWGVDNESVLSGRTAAEVYSDYMESFRVNFDEFFNDRTIPKIEIGLGPSGELCYPSFPKERGWKYPGIGEFQYFDEYLMNSLTKAAEEKYRCISKVHPKNVGSYNSHPDDTKFFSEGKYGSDYGEFFLSWYSQVLVDHADLVLHLARLTFDKGIAIAAKISGVHWYFDSDSHAAELTAGYHTLHHRNGYASIVSMVKKHDAILKFTSVELCASRQQKNALSYPEMLVWQVMNTGWRDGISVAAENALPCYERHGYNKILKNAKPLDHPEKRHLSDFTYQKLSDDLFEEHNLYEFVRFVKRMHGESVNDLRPFYCL